MSYPSQRTNLELAETHVLALGAESSEPVQTLEAGESPTFADLMREQVTLLDEGNVTLATFPSFMGIANQVALHGDMGYTGPDREVLAGDDAEAARRLYRARTPHAWILDSDTAAESVGQSGEGGAPAERARPVKLTAKELGVAAKVFSLYRDAKEAEIPEQKLEELRIGRARVAQTLGITDPSRFTFRELEDKIRAREVLSDAIAARRLDQFFLPRVLRSSSLGQQAAPESDVEVTAELAPEPGPDPEGGDVATTQVLTMPLPPSLEVSGRHRYAGDAVAASAPDTEGRHAHPDDTVAASTLRSQTETGIHRIDPEKDVERIATKRQLAKVAISTAITVGVASALRAADIVPFGSAGAIGVSTVLGAVSMVVATRFNKEVWGQLGSWREKRRALGKAALLGGGVGAAVATGSILVVDALSAGLDHLHSALFDNSASAATMQQIPDTSLTPPDPSTTPPPIVPQVPPDATWHTAALHHYTGVDGPDNNPWLDNTPYDAIARELDVQVQQTTGHPLDWSAINSDAYDRYVAQVLQQNGLSMGDVFHPGQSFAMDARQAIDFLKSQLPNTDLGLVGTAA